MRAFRVDYDAYVIHLDTGVSGYEPQTVYLHPNELTPSLEKWIQTGGKDFRIRYVEMEEHTEKGA